MKNSFILSKTQLVATLALSLVGLNQVVEAQKINLPLVKRATLDNGIKLILMEYHRAPTLTVRVSFEGGSRFDPPGKSGATSLMTTLLRKGVEGKDAQKIAEEIDFLGGSLGAGAGDENCNVSLNVLAKDSDTALDLMKDVIRHPTFPAEELERERKLEVSGLQTLGDDLGSIAGYVTPGVIYGNHLYGSKTTISSLKAIALEDIKASYKSAFAPERMIIVAVGDFKFDEIQKSLNSRFGDWAKSGVALPDVSPLSNMPLQRVLVDKPDATQTQMRLVRQGFKRNSPENYASILANTILGGGFTSRLVNDIRVNQSLTYGISSGFGKSKVGGSFSVSSFTKLETSRKIVDETNKTLAKIAKEGVTPKEYDKARGFLTGQFAIRVQTPEGIAGQLLDMAVNGLPDNYLSTYLPKLRSTSISEVNKICETYFAPENLSVILVGPYAKIKDQLKGMGDFEVRQADKIAD